MSTLMMPAAAATMTTMTNTTPIAVTQPKAGALPPPTAIAVAGTNGQGRAPTLEISLYNLKCRFANQNLNYRVGEVTYGK